MKWRNLKENKCPKCDKALWGAGVQDNSQTIIHPCGFKISYRKFSQIVNAQVTASLEKQWEQEYEDDQL